MKKLLILALAIVGVISSALAQKSKHLDKTIASTEVVNEYTSLSADANAGDAIINVASSSLNDNGRFATNLETGDLIFIIQVQGATINDANRKDFSWGEILDYNSCGLHEFAEVSDVPNGTSIQLSCPLKNDYTQSGKVVVVRVPRYATLTIPTSTEITGDAWDGTIGGFVVVEVEGDVSLEGDINMSEKGFRGTASTTDLGSVAGVFNEYASQDGDVAGIKGEGIAGYHPEYVLLSGPYGQGAAANAGGGGGSVDAGGGGGANAGDVTNYTGKGVPDITTNINYALAWENEEIGLSLAMSAGGGKGGYTKSTDVGDPYNDALISDANWGSGGRRSDAVGYGGRPLDYTTGRLFLGGGGGQGHGVNRRQSAGGAGGGMIYLLTNGDLNGSGSITSNGEDGEEAENALFSPDPDGAGGAGAGGTVVIKANGSISALTLSAEGGKGGDVINNSFSNSNLTGPGGGGGGGFIKTSSAGPIININGGANGVVEGTFLTGLFEPNGATGGGVGESSIQAVFLPVLTANNDTVCEGETANLSVDTANVFGASILWYDAPSGGTLITTGTDFSIPGITSDSTLYVKICPGETMVEVVAKVNSSFSVTMANDTVSSCTNVAALLEVSSGNTYSWYPSAQLDVDDQPQVYITTAISQTIYVDVSFDGNCPVTDSVYVEITPNLNVDLGPDLTICHDGSVDLVATGGVNYSWSPNSNISSTSGPMVTVDPSSTTEYFVDVDDGSGCMGRDSIIINVLSELIVADLPDLNLCFNDDTLLLAGHTGGSGGAVTYSWDDGDHIGPNRNFLSSTSGVMELKVTDGTYGCSDSTTFNFTIENITADFTYSSDTCIGDLTQLAATSTVAGYDYDWVVNGTQFLDGEAVLHTLPLIGTNEVKLIVTSPLNCKDSILKEIEIESKPINTAIISIDTVCPGDDVLYSNVYINSTDHTFEWNFGDGNTSDADSGRHVFENSGDYYITYEVTGPAGCSAQKLDSIHVAEKPVAEFTLPERVKLGEIINGVNTTEDGQLFEWENQDTLVSVEDDLVFQATNAGEICFTLKTQSKLGCKDDYTACTLVEGEELALPNTFTPNNDGFNDVYELLNAQGKTFSLEVYNRWGRQVFKRDNYANDWAGIDDDGDELSSGTYFVIATDKTFEETRVINGFVSLIR